MLPCPRCRSETKALSTRTVVEGERAYVRRRKECHSCKHRFTTSETIIEEYASSNVVMIKASTVEAMLRTLVGALAPSCSRATELVNELLRGDRSSS